MRSRAAVKTLRAIRYSVPTLKALEANIVVGKYCAYESLHDFKDQYICCSYN